MKQTEKGIMYGTAGKLFLTEKSFMMIENGTEYNINLDFITRKFTIQDKDGIVIMQEPYRIVNEIIEVLKQTSELVKTNTEDL